MSGVIQQGNQRGEWGVCGFVGVLDALPVSGVIDAEPRT